MFAAIDRGVELLVAAIFAGMVLIGFFQVFSRFVLNKTPSWSEEIQIFGHIWLVFLAIPIAYRRGAHFTVEAIRRQYSLGMHKVFDLGVELLWAGFAIVDRLLQLPRLARRRTQRIARARDPDELSLLRHDHRQRISAVRRAAPHRRRAAAGSRRAGGMITFLLTLLLAIDAGRDSDPALHRADRLHRDRDDARAGDAAVRAKNVRAARFLHAAGDALFHPRRIDHDGRRHQPAAGRFRARAGRPFPRRPRACLDRRQHGGRRRVGLVHRGRGRDRLDRHPDDEADRLQGRICRGADRDRRHHRGDHPAEHDHGDLRRDRAGLDRRPVPRRDHPGDPGRARADDHREALHLSSELSGAARSHRTLRSLRLVALGALGLVRVACAAHHRGRHPVGHLHRDRGRRHRLRLCVHHRLFRRAQDQARPTWSPILVDAAITTAMVSGIIAVSGPMGWLLSYLRVQRHRARLRDLAVAEPDRGAADHRGRDAAARHLRRTR